MRFRIFQLGMWGFRRFNKNSVAAGISFYFNGKYKKKTCGFNLYILNWQFTTYIDYPYRVFPTKEEQEQTDKIKEYYQKRDVAWNAFIEQNPEYKQNPSELDI